MKWKKEEKKKKKIRKQGKPLFDLKSTVKCLFLPNNCFLFITNTFHSSFKKFSKRTEYMLKNAVNVS